MHTNNLRQLDIAWAAGFFDGEGSVSIQLAEYKGPLTFCLKLQIANTNLDALQRVRSIFGFGKIYTVKRYEGRKQGYSLHISARNAEEFLRAIQPYSTVKSRQIKLALEFRSLRQNKPYRKRSDEDTARGRAIALALRELNGRHRDKDRCRQLYQEV